MQLELLQPLHDGRPLLPPLLVTHLAAGRPGTTCARALVQGRRGRRPRARRARRHARHAGGTRRRAPRSRLCCRCSTGRGRCDDVGAAVGERARPAVDRALELLAHHRLLVDGPIADGGDAEASSAASYAASVTRRISPAGAAAALAGASVAVVGSGRAGRRGRAAAPPRRDRARGALARRRRSDGHTSSSPHPRPTTRRCCRRSTVPASREGQAWLQLLPYDGRLDRRRAALPPRLLGVRDVLRAAPRPRAPATRTTSRSSSALPLRASAPTPLLAVAAGLAATVALRWLTAADPSLPGHLHVVEGGHPLGVSSHRVPACSALPRLRAVRAGRAGAVVRGDRRERDDGRRVHAARRGAPQARRSVLAADGHRHRTSSGRCTAPTRRRSRTTPAGSRPRDAPLGGSHGRLRERGGRRATRGRAPPRWAKRSSATPRRTSRRRGCSGRRPARSAAGRCRRGASRSSTRRSSGHPSFPFAPFTEDTELDFVEGVSLADGAPAFAPAELVFLRPPPADRPADRVPDEQRARLRADARPRRRSPRCSSSWSGTR